jgi:SAM-dependent methyltransferase
MQTEETGAISGHYEEHDFETGVARGLEAIGKASGPLTIEDLAPVDQFHIRGLEATREVAALAGLGPGQRVLDVGGGIGGPARTLAADFDCRVTVLDLTPAFVRLGEQLTARTGLADRVSFRQGSALEMPFEAESFDVAWTQHASMNIGDKERLYAEIQRVLRPGGRLAFHDIMAGPNEPIHFPVPWASRPEISFLRRPDEIRALLARLGFRELAFEDKGQEAASWFRQRLAAAREAGAPPPLGLHLLLGPGAATALGNVLRNIEEDRVEVVAAVYERG